MEDARRFFDAIASRYDRDYALSGAASRARMDRVLAALAEIGPSPLDVLCLGVGTGRELPALFDAGHTPVGLDASTEMLAVCARRARRPELVVADLYAKLPFPNASFDAALALHGTLAHPPHADAYRALAGEIARVLRPGGALVAEVPDAARLEDDEGAQGHLHARRERGLTRFRHVDPRGSALEGVALTRDGWIEALAPHLDARVTPLDARELFVVAARA